MEVEQRVVIGLAILLWIVGMDQSSNSYADYKVGDLVIFRDRGNVYRGVVKRKTSPYLFVETGDALWRVLLRNVISN